MDTNQQTILDLRTAEAAFNRVGGKHDLSETRLILSALDIGEDARELVRKLIDRAFANGAFAGYLRYEGLVQSIEIAAIWLQRTTTED